MNTVEDSYLDKQTLMKVGRHGHGTGTNEFASEAEQVHQCLGEGMRSVAARFHAWYLTRPYFFTAAVTNRVQASALRAMMVYAT